MFILWYCVQEAKEKEQEERLNKQLADELRDPVTNFLVDSLESEAIMIGNPNNPNNTDNPDNLINPRRSESESESCYGGRRQPR